MPKRATGRYERTTVGGEEVAAFVPHALPPADPPIVVDAALTERLRAAEQALGRLELAGEMVPSLDWFIYTFVRKEAVLSSQIEVSRRRVCPRRALRGVAREHAGAGSASGQSSSKPCRPSASP